MLGKIGTWRHVVVAGAIGGTALLAAVGVIGGRGERFDSKVVTVQPIGDDGIRIREVVDEDFGNQDRHGYERIIPIDFGVPGDIQASSPDANADVNATAVREGLRIRVGDPDTTVTGQHRYVLAYTLPQSQTRGGRLALDIVAPGEKLQTDRFQVVVRGFDLADPKCSVGKEGATGGCTLERDGDVYRATFTPLKKGQGITIGGTIVGSLPIADADDPPLPARRPDDRMKVALATIPLGLLGAGAAFYAARRAGRNEVFAGGAADAAYGSLPSPAADAPPVPVVLVPDSKMDELATIEFVPPKGIEPWQGSVLLNEKIDRTTVAAWVSGRVANDQLSLSQDEGSLVLRKGKHYADLKGADKAIVDRLLDHGDELTLGEYNESFGEGWSDILTLERESIAESGWWKRLPPSSARSGSVGGLVVVAIIALVFFGAGSVITALLGAFRGKALALVFAIAVPAIIAHFVYKVLTPARSATGSALTLRAESFRRFLAASEGKHVDWAWKQGLLREYSAWAVALGAADAWGRALANSNVPAPEMNVASSPIWLYSMAPSFQSTSSAPAPSGGSSGGSFGGFSGGSVGGGGGGGSSGSW